MIYFIAMDVGLLRDEPGNLLPAERPICSSRSLTLETLMACSVAPDWATATVSGVFVGKCGEP